MESLAFMMGLAHLQSLHFAALDWATSPPSSALLSSASAAAAAAAAFSRTSIFLHRRTSVRHLHISSRSTLPLASALLSSLSPEELSPLLLLPSSLSLSLSFLSLVSSDCFPSKVAPFPTRCSSFRLWPPCRAESVGRLARNYLSTI